jgi:hypothetical protein
LTRCKRRWSHRQECEYQRVDDHQRYTLNRDGKSGVGGVMLAVFNEADIRAAQPVTNRTRLKVVISQLREEPAEER